jgi:hypothetical protein
MGALPRGRIAMPLICRLFADERGVGKLTVAVFFVVSAVVALLVFPPFVA